jgi:hypothetical protein
MAGQMDARQFFLVISALCLFGAIVSAFFAIASGIMFAQGPTFLGLNVHVLYLFTFGAILWSIQHLRNMVDKAATESAIVPKKSTAKRA